MRIETIGRADEKIEELRVLADLRARLAQASYTGPALLVGIFLSPRHDEHVAATEARAIPGYGLEGDRPYAATWGGRRMTGRQISVMNAEVLEALGVAGDVPGDNLIVRGIDLSAFDAGDLLRIGDAILVATGAAHNPCRKFKERTSAAHYVAVSERRRRGAMFDAREPATITVGDAVERIVME